MKNYVKFMFLAVVIFVSIVIRLPGLQLAPVDDEAIWVIGIDESRIRYDIITHPPLTSLIYWLFLNVFGYGYQTFRFTALVFGILTIIVTYCLAREIYGEGVARVSVVMMAVSFYSILASLQIDMDGSILCFLTSFTLYAYFIYLKSNSYRWLLVSSVFFSLSLLTKYSAVVIVLIVFVYMLISRRDKLASMLPFVVIGGAIFLVFPVVSYVSGNWAIFTDTLVWGSENVESRGMGIMKSSVKHLYRLVQYGTPLLLLFPLISFARRRKKEENLLYVWFVVYFLFYTFVVSGGNISRYFMIIIPPLVILSARAFFILFGSVGKRDLLSIVGVALVLFGVICLQNGGAQTIEPFTLERQNFNVISQNADIWYYSTSGPLFRVSSFSFIFVLVGSVLLAVLCSFAKGHARKLWILFVAISLAFNMFLVEEFLFHGYSPDYNVVMEDMVSYYNDNNLPQPLYSVNEDIAYFLTNGSFYNLKSGDARLTLGKEGGTAVLLNLPKIMSLSDDGYIGNSMINDVDEKCELLKVFYVGEYDAGYIYNC